VSITKKTINILKVIFLAIALLFLVIVAAVNLPFVHTFIAKKANTILSEKGIPVHVGKITLLINGKVGIRNLEIYSSPTDTIIYAEKVNVAVDIIPLFSKKISFDEVSLSNAVINIITDPLTGEINIASVFSSSAGTPDPEETQTKKSNKKPWDISGNGVTLKNIRFKYSDPLGGILVKQSLSKANIDIDYFSLQNRQIDVGHITIEKPIGMVGIWEGKEKESNDSVSVTDWKFMVKKLNIEDLIFELNQPDIGQSMNVSLEKGNISTSKINLLTSEIKVNDVHLIKPKVYFIKDSLIKTESEPEVKTNSSLFVLPMLSWNITNENFEIDDGLLEFRDADTTHTAELNQWLPLKNLNVLLKNTAITPKGYTLNSKMAFALSNTLNINSAELRFSYDSLHNFTLESDFTAQLDKDQNWLKKDLELNFATNIKGDTSEINIDEFKLISTTGLRFNLSGKIENPFQIENSLCDIQFATSAISRPMLSPVVYYFSPQTTLPKFNPAMLSGKIKNTVYNPYFDVQVISKSGNVKAAGNYDLKNTKGQVELIFSELLLSDLMSETFPEILTGTLSANADIKNNKAVDGDLTIEIDSVRYKRKTSHDIVFQAIAKNNEIEFSSSAADTALIYNLNGRFGWDANQSYSGAINGTVDIDLYEMNLNSTPFAGRADFNASFSYSENEITALAEIDQILLKNSKADARIDKTIFEFKSTNEQIESVLKTDFIDAKFKSWASLKEIQNALDSTQLKAVVNIDSSNFINLGAITVLDSLQLEATIQYNPVFTLFKPETLFNFSDIHIQIDKIDKDSLIQGRITSDRINFGNIESYDNQVQASLEPNRLHLEVKADSLIDNQVKFGNLGLDIDVLASSITGNINVRDTDGNDLHNVGFVAEEKEDNVIFKSSEKGWVINKNEWTMSPPEFLTWNKSLKTFTADLDLHYKDRYIGISGNNTEFIEITLENISFDDFAIPGFAELIPEGILNGNAKYTYSTTQDLDIDLQILDLKWRNISLNEIDINGKLLADSLGINNGAFKIIADDSISVQVELESDKVNNAFTLKTKFTKIHFNLFEPFIQEFASNLHGTTDGEITLSGSDIKQELNGEIRFNNFGLKVKPLEAWLTIPANKIVIDKNKFIFDSFTVIDSLKRPLTVNGYVNFIDKDDILIDMNVDAKKVQLMNTSKSKNAPLYGSIIINSGLKIGGSVNRPTIKGSVELESGTNITYQMIEDLSVQGSQNDVVFAQITDSLTVLYPVSDQMKRLSKMPNIETSIKINPKSTLNVIINDLYNVDISITGNGLLNYNMLPNNTMSMNGVYTINSGKCDLKITGWPLKNFEITPGSSLNWNGTVENPDLNLEATTKVRGSYANPIDNRTRVVDFVVTMKFTDQLSDLKINFGIQSADQYITSVLSSLSSDEIMRQAINLLLFSTIEIPGVENSGNYLSSQISSFWESQLNALTSENITKTKLSFGIDTYNNSSAQGTGKEQTSITYEMERKFLNDRFTVKISGKLNDYNEGKYQTNSLFENFIVEYALDSLNTKNIKLYQKRDFEDMLEGEVIKYGIGFLYRKNYKKLSDIWRRKKQQGTESQNNNKN
jgi:hypothetical protein